MIVGIQPLLVGHYYSVSKFYKSKKQEILKNWVEKKAKNVFIEIVDDYSECDYGYNWIN